MSEPQASAPIPPAPDPQAPVRQVRLRSGTNHPFIFRRMIDRVDPVTRPGEIVNVLDKRGQLLGKGFYHDRSQIAVRMLTWQDEPVNDDFFRRQLARAVEWRKQIIGDTTDTNVYRLVYAEGDSLSGLIAERYHDWIAIEVFSLGVFQRLDLLKRMLTELTGVTQFVVRADERIEFLEGFRVTPAMSDAVPPTITIKENNIRFRVDLRSGHKTGFFCDQRDNRRRLAGLVAGKEVLDICCYTGGFSIYAAMAGQAASVTGVDLDEEAIELAKANAKLNQVRVDWAHADGFSYLRQMRTNGKSFDVVILDPPKFVPNRDGMEEGAQKYVDLNILAMTVLKPGGLLVTCSCSGVVDRERFAGMVSAAAYRAGRQLQVVDITGPGPDHPVMANCPESAYLKVIWARIL